MSFAKQLLWCSVQTTVHPKPAWLLRQSKIQLKPSPCSLNPWRLRDLASSETAFSSHPNPSCLQSTLAISNCLFLGLNWKDLNEVVWGMRTQKHRSHTFMLIHWGLLYELTAWPCTENFLPEWTHQCANLNLPIPISSPTSVPRV